MLVGLAKVSTYVFPEIWGSKSLGKNLYTMDWDSGEKIIVLGHGFDGNVCVVGSSIVPTPENQTDSLGKFAEYVSDVKFDNKFVIVRTGNFRSGKVKYYIIDKNYDVDNILPETIIKDYTTVYDDSVSFANDCLRRNIKLKF